MDAHILLEPVEKIVTKGHILNGPFLAGFAGVGVNNIPQETFPSGFYRFSRRSFVNVNQYITGLTYAFRKGGRTFIRRFEPKEAMRQQGLSADAMSREFRGYVTRQEDGVAMLISRRNSMTSSFNYLARVTSFENNYWIGYVARTVRESASGIRVTRMVYEHLGNDRSSIYAVARSAGFLKKDDLLPFHRSLLQTKDDFF
jgi:hypothetical protein